MAQFPALPLWTDAFLADTHHLTNAEAGLYCRLLILMWRTPGCRVPNDSEWLERRFPSDLPALRKIVSEFCQTSGNWITQKRLVREFEYVTQRNKKQSERIKSRWDKEKDSYRGNTPTPTPIGIDRKQDQEAFGGRERGKPRHGITNKQGRIWIDRCSSEWESYATDYRTMRGKDPSPSWNGSGAWFNVNGEPA